MISACLPVAAYALLFWAFRSNRYGWRAAAICSAAWWGVLTIAITELLSVFVALNRTGLALAWGFVDAVILVYLNRLGSSLVSWRAIRRTGSIYNPGTLNRIFIAGIIINLLLIGMAAIICPPNTGDAMTYHMPRIVHWIHNQTVAFYPTHDFRQISLQPLAEYAMLQFHALSGGDRFDPLIQWFGLVGSVVAASAVAELLGALYPGQILAALLCATVPQGVLEASGAKNDVVLSFWLISLFYFLLAFGKEPKLSNAIGIGATLGLACMTKGTAYVFAPPLLAAAVLVWSWRVALKHVKYLILAGGLFIALNLGHYVRDFRLFGSPLGPIAFAPPRGFKISNDAYGPSEFASNVLRNIALQASLPSEEMKQSIERNVKRVVNSFTDVSDPRTTWDGTTFVIPEFRLHETIASNPIHVILIVITIIIVLWRWRMSTVRPVLVSTVALVFGFALFCLELKWQPWHTRLHLPLFILWGAVCGVVLAKSWPQYATAGLGAGLLLISGLYTMGNYLRPLAWPGAHSIFRETRQAMYFNDAPGLMSTFVDLANFVNEQHCNNIGLNGPENTYEYPLLVLLKDVDGSREIRDVDISNVSKAAANKAAPAPCIVICMSCEQRIDLINIYAPRFTSGRTFGDTTVFSNAKENHPAAAYASSDFDHNKVPDLVVQNEATRRTAVHYLGFSGGVAWRSSAGLPAGLHPGWHVAAVGDFDRNGTPDLVWEEISTGHLLIEYHGGAKGTELQGELEVQPGDITGFRVVAAADFNRDGIPDLIWQDHITGQTSVWYMGGKGGATRRQWSWLYRGNAGGWHVPAAADFDGDGVPDLVWQNDKTRQVTVHYYRGALGNVDAGYSWLSTTGVPGWHVVMAADFNGDLVPDLVWQNDDTGEIRVHYYGGVGGSTERGSALLKGPDLRGWTVVSH